MKMKGLLKKKTKGKKAGRRSGSPTENSDSERSSSIAGVRDNILGALGGVAFGIGGGLGQKGFDSDRYGDGILTEAMRRVRTRLLQEQEIEYLLGVLKKNSSNMPKDERKELF